MVVEVVALALEVVTHKQVISEFFEVEVVAKIFGDRFQHSGGIG